MFLKWGPKQADHPSVGDICPLCDRAFKEGDMTTGIPIQAASKEDQIKKDKGSPYTAEAKEVHLDCAKTHILGETIDEIKSN